MTPLEEWDEVGGGFTAKVDGADPASWDAPAPVPGWVARDVVRHLVEWFPGFLESGAGVRLEVSTRWTTTPSPPGTSSPAEVRALLDDPANVRAWC